MTSSLPILYSFRRCPYAMRARLGLVFAGLTVELREVVLRNKPAQLLEISPKATVPVLQLATGQVIEESLEILTWALNQQDPSSLLNVDLTHAEELIECNDQEFKYWLDRYKYFDRYPEAGQLEYRQKGEQFLQQLEKLLAKNNFLLGKNPSKADLAIMPFVRQFAHVNREEFYQLPYQHLQKWLQFWLAHPVFEQIMKKYPPWQVGDKPSLFNLINNE